MVAIGFQVFTYSAIRAIPDSENQQMTSQHGTMTQGASGIWLMRSILATVKRFEITRVCGASRYYARFIPDHPIYLC
jgi:hypothetical protein